MFKKTKNIVKTMPFIKKHLDEKNATELKIDTTLLKERDSNNPNAVFRDFELTCFNITAKDAKKNEILKFNPLLSSHILKKIYTKLKRNFFGSNVIIQNKHDWDDNHLAIKNNKCIIGRWQSESYFIDIEKVIKNEFIFKNKLNNYSLNIKSNIEESESVSIQIRRTDYITNKLYSTSIGALDIQYYIDAIKQLSKLNKKYSFFVFSDDINWAKKKLPKDFFCFTAKYSDICV